MGTPSCSIRVIERKPSVSNGEMQCCHRCSTTQTKVTYKLRENGGTCSARQSRGTSRLGYLTVTGNDICSKPVIRLDRTDTPFHSRSVGTLPSRPLRKLSDISRWASKNQIVNLASWIIKPLSRKRPAADGAPLRVLIPYQLLSPSKVNPNFVA